MSQTQSASTDESGKGLTLFLVDDDPAVLKTLGRTLERLGVKVRGFTTPNDALKIALAAPPAGIVSDYYMPDENGVDFLSRVERALPECARVILTGGRMDERLMGAIKTGAVQRLVKKPWSESTLREMVDVIRLKTFDTGKPATQTEEVHTISQPGLARQRVIVVDDDEFFLGVSNALLAKLGCQVESFTSTSPMLELLSSGDFDVVLMDLLLDGESGVDAIRAVKTTHPHIPVIAVTGSTERQLAIAALQSGAAGVLHKPLDAMKLGTALNHAANFKALECDAARRPELAALLGLQHTISSGTSEDGLLDALLQQIIRLTQADRACIFLSGNGHESFEVSANYGCGREQLEQELPFLRGLCHRIYDQRSHQVVVEVPPDGSREERPGRGPQTVLALPLRGRDSIVGVVIAVRDSGGGSVGRGAIELGLLMAGEVGQAVERMRVEELSREMERSVMRREKLVTIGELASGVAHEINNPLGYVSSNVHSLREYFQELAPILQCLTAADGGPDPDRAVALARQRRVDELLEDLPDCISETLGGIDRVLKIVNDLRAFARDDAESKEAADVNQILDGAIQILWNQLKHKAELVSEFGDLPAFQCYPSQLCQVFLNLLYNSVQAIERSGKIVVRTFVEGDHILIEFSDDGCGMESAVLDRIFEPFYTTKPRGVGTGLGLSITRKIVERHGGRISATSQVGLGTTFCVFLPI